MVTSCDSQGVTSDIREVETFAPVTEEITQKVNITFSGGSGRAHVKSPVTVVTKGGKSLATLVFSSENYDYVIADGQKILNENPGGKSTFTVPVASFDEPLVFIADTTAMSKPHEIEYTITWNVEASSGSDEAEDYTEVDNGTKFGQKPAGYTEPEIPHLEATGQMELMHAKGFAVKEYGKYHLISIYGVGEYLLVPEGEDKPDDIPGEVTVLAQPLDSVYLVSTSVMDLVRQTGALDAVKLSGLDEDGWHVDEAKERIRDGRMEYAGKYRAPDYELILSKGCDLAIENTMIFHNPEVKEKLEELGIPVIVETSSYEKDPLARLEWIKLYGLLFDKEDEACDFYEKTCENIERLSAEVKSDKSVAVFSISATGMINTRTTGDYVATMIRMAGGNYVPGASSFGGRTNSATLNMQPEEYLAAAGEADILIYNSTIEGEIGSIADLIAKNEMFATFKAVKAGDVYCLTSDYFQKTTGAQDLLEDLGALIKGSERDFVFLEKLKQ